MSTKLGHFEILSELSKSAPSAVSTANDYPSTRRLNHESARGFGLAADGYLRFVVVQVGTSGWSYDHWKGVLYEPGVSAGARLQRYAEEFDTVELNASFYRWPADVRFIQWRDRLPTGFTMSVKAPRGLTHARWCSQGGRKRHFSRDYPVCERAVRLQEIVASVVECAEQGSRLRDDTEVAGRHIVQAPGGGALSVRTGRC